VLYFDCDFVEEEAENSDKLVKEDIAEVRVGKRLVDELIHIEVNFLLVLICADKYEFCFIRSLNHKIAAFEVLRAFEEGLENLSVEVDSGADRPSIELSALFE
jgi:hypothetical protein